MKTFEDCKNEIAVREGYKDSLDLMKNFNPKFLDRFYEEAAMLYGKMKWDECAELVIKEMSETYNTHFIERPPFKP